MHKNLVIDIGNTFTKLALFSGKEMHAYTVAKGISLQAVKDFCLQDAEIGHAIVSSVRDVPPEVMAYLQSQTRLLEMSAHLKLPFTNAYLTPATLGKDRLAAVAGAQGRFPGHDVLCLDAGTALTYDLLTAGGQYKGGGISPGIHLRYKALHHFTGRLPLIEREDDAALVGNSTGHSIASGVLNGILAEVEGIVGQYAANYPGIKVLMTGGDHLYFVKRLKVKTFAAPNLVLEGLNLLLNYNLEPTLS